MPYNAVMESVNAPFSLSFDPSLREAPPKCGLAVALVWATGLPGCPGAEAAPAYLEALLASVRAAGEAFLPQERKSAVRDLLRHGKYKPAGRGRPSSEYLLAAALEGDFPLVNGPVDANNAVSLEWGYPASVFDAAKTGRELLIKRGGPEDRYVFNRGGQEIELEDLLCAWRRSGGEGWEACGNPVKDAMATKVFEDCREVVAVVYAPAGREAARLDACAARFREILEGECGALSSGAAIIGL
jgi:DNA/RNA-binding domain of Phe-tRNA-synthetase-like protein